MTVAAVKIWGTTIGAVALDGPGETARFEYEPDFRRSGIELSPVVMPLGDRVYAFPGLPRESFHGLPGMLADSLPDRFGNALIDVWLATQGRTPASFDAVERLCYTGARGMGALEFVPVVGPRATASRTLRVDKLVELASEVLRNRGDLRVSFADESKEEALGDILRVGTSAGGARAKAILAWNPETHEVRSGQIRAGDGFEYWILKFDGVSGNRDKELEDPQGYGSIEYAYHRMASAAGVTMSECRVLEENGRRHFMTKRFDRRSDGDKLHMQSLCGIAHYDFNAAGAYSYEQAMLVMRQLGLSMDAIEQQFRRMVFNIVARNQDDHTKNIAFLMDRSGTWSLAPAYDVIYSYNPTGQWTSRHQMSCNGKLDGFTVGDLNECAKAASMKRGRAESILAEVADAVSRWAEFAEEAKVDATSISKISRVHRLDLAG